MTRPSPPEGVTGPHLVALDGVRGLAIVLVLFVHFVGDNTPRGVIERSMVRLANYGAWGVDLFFVLSGFLITGILWDSKTKPHYFRNFYVRRTLRIFPLHYAALALLFVVVPRLPIAYPAGLAEAHQHQEWLWAYAGNLYLSLRGTWTALPFVGHFWSLAVEEHFYLVWPVVVLLCSRRRLLAVCVGCSLFALGLRSVLALSGVSDVALVALTPCRLDALCIGAFLAVSSRTVGIETLGRHARPALLVLASLVLLTTGWNAVIGALPGIVLPVRGSLVALAFGALLVVTLTSSSDSPVGRVFRSPTLRFFGKYSYGLYVFQAIIATWFQASDVEGRLTDALRSHALAMVLQAAIGVGASTLLAVLSYELFEKHFLRLKGRLAPANEAVASPRVPDSARLV